MTISSCLIFSNFVRPYMQLSGDELLGCMRVSKAWHQEILTNQKKIEEPLIKLFEVVFFVLQKKNPQIELDDYYSNFIKKKLKHPVFQIANATTLPQIDKKVHLAFSSLAKKIREWILGNPSGEEYKIFFDEMKVKKIPFELINHFKFALDFERRPSLLMWFETAKQKDEFKMNELSLFIKSRLIEHTSFSWKVKILKRSNYNKITKQAFKYFAEELVRNGFYNSAVQFLVSRNLTNEFGLPIMEFLSEQTDPLQGITLIGAVQDRLSKGKLLLKLMEIKEFDHLLIDPNVTFDAISFLPNTICQSFLEGFSQILCLLIKNQYLSKWELTYLLNKIDKNLIFFEKFIRRLILAGFFENAIEMLQEIDKSSSAGKSFYLKAARCIVVQAIKKGAYKTALNATQYISDKQMQKEFIKEIESKQSHL